VCVVCGGYQAMRLYFALTVYVCVCVCVCVLQSMLLVSIARPELAVNVPEVSGGEWCDGCVNQGMVFTFHPCRV
jgi:hypothetical protein